MAATSRTYTPRGPRVNPALLTTMLVILCASGAGAHGSLDDEIAQLSRRIDTGHSTGAECLQRGELRRLKKDWSGALADYDRAEKLDPTLNIDLCRAALELDRDRPARAKPLLDRFLLRHPGHPDALRLRSRAAIALGRPAEAVADLDAMLDALERPSPDDYVWRARTVTARGPDHVPDALQGLDRAIERLGPLVSLGSCAIDLELDRRDWDAALARLDRIAPQFPRRAVVDERRGEILIRAGRHDEARRSFAAALVEVEALPPERRATPAMAGLETRLRSRLAERPASGVEH
jgi:tetratricopeptide (TPR) repeat protein